VFAPDGKTVAAKIQKNGKYTLGVNGKIWKQTCDQVWDPVFSPDGGSILARFVEDGNYVRRIIKTSEIGA